MTRAPVPLVSSATMEAKGSVLKFVVSVGSGGISEAAALTKGKSNKRDFNLTCFWDWPYQDWPYQDWPYHLNDI